MTEAGECDEWTMICPPGWLALAEAMAEVRPENIREIVESPIAEGKFLLVNDSELGRFWDGFKAEPVRLADPPSMLDRYRLAGLAVISPSAMIRLTGI